LCPRCQADPAKLCGTTCCPTGQTCLVDNGTCVRLCPNGFDADCPHDCGFCAATPQSGSICGQSGASGSCLSAQDCPQGQFCDGGGSCQFACTT
jgi:hypothetical protein